MQAGQSQNILGTLLIASEGINGTIAGSQQGIEHMIMTIEQSFGIQHLDWKKSHAQENPFLRFKVKIKKEIVTLGQNSLHVAEKTGKYIQPKDWNDIISDSETLVIDTRNTYETNIGMFPNAIDPQTENFRDFPDFVHRKLAHEKNRKIAMYCTGGIRCEKASNYLLSNLSSIRC